MWGIVPTQDHAGGLKPAASILTGIKPWNMMTWDDLTITSAIDFVLYMWSSWWEESRPLFGWCIHMKYANRITSPSIRTYWNANIWDLKLWLWVKTLVPTEPRNSWCKLMFVLLKLTIVGFGLLIDKSNTQWIGFRDNSQDNPIFNGKIYGFL